MRAFGDATAFGKPLHGGFSVMSILCFGDYARGIAAYRGQVEPKTLSLGS